MVIFELGGGKRQRFQDNYEVRTRLSGSIGQIIKATVCRELRVGMDERQATTAMRTALQLAYSHYEVDDYTLSVFGHEATSLRKGSQESKTGLDFYLGVEIRDFARTAKGLLVQAKRSNRLSDPKLKKQCMAMLAKSSESYVWVYDPANVYVIPASHIIKSSTVSEMLTGRIDVDHHIDNILVCTSGSEAIGIGETFDRDIELVRIMNELSADEGVQIVIEQNPMLHTW